MPLQKYSAASAEFDDIETTLGEIGAMITRVANALVLAPDSIVIAPRDDADAADEAHGQVRICAEAWPTGHEIIALLEKRKLLRDFLTEGKGPAT
jgi:hypothetical protein